MQNAARICGWACLTFNTDIMMPFSSQRVWVNYLGIYGQCRELSGSWVLIEDDEGRMHAVLADDVEVVDDDAQTQGADLPPTP